MANATVISIGNFDGVHAGHRRILRQAKTLARAKGARLLAMTFDPPPAAVLRPGSEPPRLMESDEKTAALRQAGADEVVVLRPTPELLGLTAEQFVQRVVERHRPVAFVEGLDFRFGKNRGGDVHLLETLGPRFGFETQVIEKVVVPLQDQVLAPVSSSLIRWLLAHGRVADAARCLGQAYALSAPVVLGEQRGRQLDVPTANLDLATMPGRMIPGEGVYAGLATLADGSIHAAAISIGNKPTLARQDLTIEAHLLDFKGDLYGQRLMLCFCRWVRDQQPFPDLEALRCQLGRDLALVRRWHGLGLLDTLRVEGQEFVA